MKEIDKFSYSKRDWYLTTLEDIKKDLIKHHLTFEQAQYILEDLIKNLNKTSQKNYI